MESTFRSGTTVLGKYRIESVLGRDGMYVALRVSHAQLGELVLKMLMPDTSISLSVHARFVREAQSATRLRGEHVARLIDVGISSDGVPYLVTEAVRGVELGAELARRGALIPAEAVDYLLQVCDALAEAHAHGIVHRHVSPASVLLTASPDGSPLVKLLDFGIVQLPPAASSPMDPIPRADAATGATAYMAPEQIRVPDEVDGRADIWAVGAVLYECLTGHRPFVEPASASGRVAATAAPQPMDPRIPPGLQAVVLRCLDGDREARFPSIAALVAALAPYAHDHRTAGFLVERANRLAQGVHDAVETAAVPSPHPVLGALAPPAAAPGGSRAWTRRRYATIAVIALGVSIGGIATAALIRPARSRDPSPVIAAKPVAANAGIDPPATSAGPTTVPATAMASPSAASPGTTTGSGAASPSAPTAPTAAPTAASTDDEQARKPAAPTAASTDDEQARKRTDEARVRAPPPAAPRPVAPPPAAPRPAAPQPAAPPRKDSCDTVDVGDLMTRAATQYDAGSASSALSLTRVALGCKQTDRMYWLAVMYACAAHDLAGARLYFPRVPANLQPGIERRCQQDNLDVRTR